jgi:hypothetical protein
VADAGQLAWVLAHQRAGSSFSVFMGHELQLRGVVNRGFRQGTLAILVRYGEVVVAVPLSGDELVVFDTNNEEELEESQEEHSGVPAWARRYPPLLGGEWSGRRYRLCCGS